MELKVFVVRVPKRITAGVTTEWSAAIVRAKNRGRARYLVARHLADLGVTSVSSAITQFRVTRAKEYDAAYNASDPFEGLVPNELLLALAACLATRATAAVTTATKSEDHNGHT